MMEEFIEAFMEIQNANEMANREQLRNYCGKKGLDLKRVDDLMKQFDTDKDGNIFLDEFCRGLGLDSSEIRTEKIQRDKLKSGKAPTVAKDIEIIKSKLNRDMEVIITEQYKRYITEAKLNNTVDMAGVAKKMKYYLDQTYGPDWQIVIGQRSYWIVFSHEPFRSLQFKHGDHDCLFWRVPRN